MAASCSGINDKMSYADFERYVKNHPKDSIDEKGDYYYKVLSEGKKSDVEHGEDNALIEVTTLKGESLKNMSHPQNPVFRFA